MAMTRDAVWWRRPWNRGLKFFTRLGWLGADTQPDQLLERARRETALDDFGDMEFLEPMRLLIREFEANANADLAGSQVFASMVLGSLKNRLHIRKAIHDYPDITRQAITAPIFIVGLPRTGTTLLQGLLASASGLRTPLRWETDLTSPAPPALSSKREIRTQIRSAKGQAGFANRMSPGIPLAHAVGALLPEECNPLMMTSFRSLLHCTFFRCPEYHDYLYRTRFLHAYDWHKLHLQLLAFGSPPTTWSLKAPVHLGSLPELLRTYPDARVVFTHRDPLEAIPSMGALTAALHKLVAPAHDKALIGRDLMRNLAMMESAGHAARENWPADAPRFVDVRYPDLVADPLGTVRGILRHFDMAEDEDLPERIAGYQRENRRQRQRTHRYSLADFDLREDEIRTVFASEFRFLA
jgi:Sulfotransferase family